MDEPDFRLRIIGLDEKYRQAAVLVPVLAIASRDHFVLERRSPDISQGGEISFPGGMMDRTLDTGSRAAALRETCEELGLVLSDIGTARYLGSCLTPMGIITHAWTARLAAGSETRIQADPAEVSEVLFLPVEWCSAHPPERHAIHPVLHPWVTDGLGQRTDLLPSRELGLPMRYHEAWSGRPQPVWSWRTAHGTIWGLTAEILREALKQGSPELESI